QLLRRLQRFLRTALHSPSTTIHADSLAQWRKRRQEELRCLRQHERPQALATASARGGLGEGRRFVSCGNWRAAQPSSPAELGCIESKAAEVEQEGSEPGKLKLIPSLGLEQGFIARIAGSAVSKADQDLLRHARGRTPWWTFARMFSARPITTLQRSTSVPPRVIVFSGRRSR